MKTTIESIKSDIQDWDMLEEEIVVYFENNEELIIDDEYFKESEFIDLDTIAKIILENKLRV